MSGSAEGEADTVDTREPVLAERSGHALWITLHRPERLNAVSEGLYEGLQALLEEADSADDVRVVVLRGSGRAFCVGADLKAHAQGRSRSQQRRYIGLGQSVFRQIQNLSKPVIAAVHGYAIGAGAELALSADFLVIVDTAQIRFPEVSIGTYVAGGVTYRLPQLVGLVRARELIQLGRPLSGDEAAAWGLAHRAVPEGGFQDAVAELVALLAAQASVPMAFSKRHLQLAASRDAGEMMALETEATLACMATDDWAEGVAAFKERRVPLFRGH